MGLDAPAGCASFMLQPECICQMLSSQVIFRQYQSEVGSILHGRTGRSCFRILLSNSQVQDLESLF